jgi:Putative peptidoglycan binding domain
MRNLRPALLVLLTSSLAGLGVPVGLAQTKADSKNAKTPSTSPKNTSGKSTASKTTAAKRPAGSTPAAKSSHSSPAPSKKTPTNAPSKPLAASAKKGSSKSSKKSSRKQPGQKAPATDRVIEIQSALAKDGSFHGSPSGKWDEDTTAAMRKFQSTHGLNPSGKLDAPTLQRLGLGSQTAGVAAPTPPPGSFSRLTSSNAAPAAIEIAPRQ